MVSQPLESSPMASKTPQRSHDPRFRAPVTLKHDESVEGDIEGSVGRENAQFDTEVGVQRVRAMCVVNFPHTPLEANNACPKENQITRRNQMKTIRQLTACLDVKTTAPRPQRKRSTKNSKILAVYKATTYHVNLHLWN